MALTKVSGSVLKNPLSLSGNVSVGGTLTYEDVTNVDAIGIITARSDISIADKIIHTGDTNTAIRFPAADTFAVETEGSERLRIASDGNIGIGEVSPTHRLHVQGSGTEIARFEGANGARLKLRNSTNNIFLAYTDSSDIFQLGTNGQNVRVHVAVNGNVGLNETNPGHKLTVGGDGYFGFTTPNDAARQIIFNANRGSAGQTLANINWQWNSKNVAQIRGIAGADTTNKDDGHLAFFTSSANSLIERLRIDSSGRLGVGDNSPDRELVVKNASSNSSIKIEASNAHTSQLFFSDTDAENVGRISVFHGSGQSTSNGMLFDVGGTARLMINSSGQLIVNTVTSTDAIFTVSSPNHYVVTSSGKAHKHIHCRSVNGNSGEYGGAISFGMGSDGSSAIAAEQMSSSGNVNGLAFFTHDTSTGSDDSVKKMRINNTGGIMLNNWENNRGFIFQRLGAGTFPDLANVQGSQGRGMIDAQKTINQNTTTNLCASHWGGLALIGYSGTGHQGVRHVMFGYGGAGVSVRFSGNWVGSLTTTFSMSAYTLRVSHNASNALDFWVILIGI